MASASKGMDAKYRLPQAATADVDTPILTRFGPWGWVCFYADINFICFHTIYGWCFHIIYGWEVALVVSNREIPVLTNVGNRQVIHFHTREIRGRLVVW